MTKQFNLSDKEKNMNSNPLSRYRGCFDSKDVKEFIKRLKEQLPKIQGTSEDTNEICTFIDKLAGDKLTETRRSPTRRWRI